MSRPYGTEAWKAVWTTAPLQSRYPKCERQRCHYQYLAGCGCEAVPYLCCLKTPQPPTKSTFIGVLSFRTRCTHRIAPLVACADNGRIPGDAERWGCHSLQRSWKEHGMHLQH